MAICYNDDRMNVPFMIDQLALRAHTPLSVDENKQGRGGHGVPLATFSLHHF